MSFEKTLEELNVLYPAGEDDHEMDDNVHGLSSSVPEAIRTMAGCKAAVEALGSMIWCVSHSIGEMACMYPLPSAFVQWTG